MKTPLKVALWLGLAAFGLAVFVAVATRSAEAKNTAPLDANAMRVCIAEREAAGTGRSGWHPLTLALVLGSVPEKELALAELEELLDQSEESANPLALDLDLDSADASEQKRLVRALWPRVNAAQSWLSPELERGGHALVRCDDAAARYSLWKENEALPPAPAQLRQRAWATAALAIVRSGDPERLGTRLKNRSAEPDSKLALVVGPLTRADGLSRLGARAKRLAERARRAGQPEPPLLLLLAKASDAGELPLALGAGDLAVVPRLGALSKLPEFTAEIERALDGGDRFVHRPEPITGAGSTFRESE